MSSGLTLQQARSAYEFADEAHEELLAKNRRAELDAWNASVLPHLATLLDLDPKALDADADNSASCVAPWKRDT